MNVFRDLDLHSPRSFYLHQKPVPRRGNRPIGCSLAWPQSLIAENNGYLGITYGEHGVVVRAFSLFWGGIRFESLSTHHCWSLIPSLVVWSVTKNNVIGGENKTKRATVSSRTFVTLSKSL